MLINKVNQLIRRKIISTVVKSSSDIKHELARLRLRRDNKLRAQKLVPSDKSSDIKLKFKAKRRRSA